MYLPVVYVALVLTAVPLKQSRVKHGPPQNSPGLGCCADTMFVYDRQTALAKEWDMICIDGILRTGHTARRQTQSSDKTCCVSILGGGRSCPPDLVAPPSLLLMARAPSTRSRSRRHHRPHPRSPPLTRQRTHHSQSPHALNSTTSACRRCHLSLVLRESIVIGLFFGAFLAAAAFLAPVPFVPFYFVTDTGLQTNAIGLPACARRWRAHRATR
jgi:hypothetical protein